MSDREPAGADLAALERELTGLLVGYEILRTAWPKAPTAIDRARIGREIDKAECHILEIYTTIAATEARNLADAAVQLRRVSARLEGGDDMSRVMLASALAVVEAT